MNHHVFIERCRDSEPATATSLAQAIAARYQIDPQQILGRLRTGRFRVKANLELAAARAFVDYLESQGALCSIVDDAGTTVARSAALIQSAAAPEADDDWGLTLHTPPPPDDDEGAHYESGLAAGFSGGADSQDLGVLADAAAASSGSLRLSLLDGGSAESKGGPSADSLADASNVEAFLPPEMLQEGKLELGDNYAEPERAPEPPAPLSAEESDALQNAPEAIPLPQRCLNQLATSARVRLAVGVFLALVMGFVVSSTVASGMEEGQYAKALTELESAYAAVDSVEAWGELDAIRATTLESLERRRTNIVITSLILWLLIAGLVVFLWLRMIHWDRWRLATSADAG